MTVNFGLAIDESAPKYKGFCSLAGVGGSSITVPILYLKIPSFGKKNRDNNTLFLSNQDNETKRCSAYERNDISKRKSA
jgi:hypothetical protein